MLASEGEVHRDTGDRFVGLARQSNSRMSHRVAVWAGVLGGGVDSVCIAVQIGAVTGSELAEGSPCGPGASFRPRRLREGLHATPLRERSFRGRQ